jgi:phage portal protein BeeE
MKQKLNEQFIRMQKIAGVINENQINEDDIFNNQYSVSNEAYKRMDGLVNENDYDNFIQSATNIMTTLTDDGFEAKEIFYYLYTRLTAEV